MDIVGTAWAWPWWSIMVAINIVNVSVCVMFFRRSKASSDGDSIYMRCMRIMGLIFIFVAAYRSVFVSRYLTQMAWFDSIANSSLLIRMLAIFAELSFSALIAFSMLRLNKDVPAKEFRPGSLISLVITKSPYILVFCIFTAQFFATAGLIMKSRLFFAIEESLWFVGFLSILPLAIVQCRRMFTIREEQAIQRQVLLRRFAIINLAWCAIYCSYGVFFHLPFEYWSTAIEQLETGVPALRSGFGAVVDALVIVNESKDYADWGFAFLLWHSAYFSVCVWLALFMMQGPRMLPDGPDTSSTP
jgi:hypothetical protein